jgi:8-oxo-dGTP pyrophosphatase MutT (NUDIX family)
MNGGGQSANAGFFERIAACNNAPPWDGARLKGYLPLLISNRVLGQVRETRAASLSGKHSRLIVRSDRVQVHLTRHEEVSSLFAEVAEKLVAAGQAPQPRGESYAIVQRFGEDPVGVVDRAYAPWFGFRAFGVHVNGYVQRDDGSVKMWLAERAKDRTQWPGHLDQMTAGGQPADLDLRENALKELAEEAGVDAAIAEAGLRSVGAISYVQEHETGLKPDTMFCFDLRLPADFEPKNTDGEVERFELWSIDDVIRTVRDTRRFKPNCALVAIDFLVRHGFLAPDGPEFADIVHGLRQPAPW